MAEVRGASALRAGEELRQIIALRRRRRRRLIIAAIVGCAVVPLAASLVRKTPVLFVWNASTSAPIGLYRVNADATVRRGDMVIAWTPQPARSLAARRRYLPAKVPLVKRVAAVAGDRVCAVHALVSINGRLAAVRQRSDAAGRPMPWWNGCRRLRAREYFLVMGNPLSFDGRYFGVTRGNDLLGRVELMWSKRASGNSGA